MKAPFKKEGLELMKAMLEAKVSEQEISYRFGKPKDKIKKMLKGEVRADQYLVDSVRKLKRG